MEARFLRGGAGRLDSRWHGPPDGDPVLLLHPHPAHGGSMGTRLVYDLAQALAEDGHRVVRYDSRGVGRSDGRYDRGVGEQEDALMVWDQVAGTVGHDPEVVGFSFGGALAVHVAALRPVPRLVCIATPARVRDSDLDVTADAGRVAGRVHLVHGTDDRLVPREQAQALADAFPSPPTWHRIPGADHFLTPAFRPAAVAAVLDALR